MSEEPRHGGRRGTYVAAAITAVLAAIGALLLAMGAAGTSGPPQPQNAGRPETSVTPTRSWATPASPTTSAPRRQPPANRPLHFGPVLPGSRPVALDIPAIDVHSEHLVPLGFTSDGNLAVPENPDDPGWFDSGPLPGQLGPAVIAGHVDSVQGPAVFYRLGALHQGDHISVTRTDGTVARFLVDRVQEFAKADFPTHAVYGNVTSRAELRLITCGGVYDDTRGGYQSNVVVFAHLVKAV